MKIYCDLEKCKKRDKTGLCKADVIALSSSHDDQTLTCDEYEKDEDNSDY